MAEKKRVLITGAAGNVGSRLAELLAERYDLRLQYHRNIPAQPPSSDTVTLSLDDRAKLAEAVQGMDAIVHMAGDPSTNATWESVLQSNIIGMYQLYEAARQAGVPKIVFASTNHVMGMYDRDGDWPVYSRQPVRPDSLYGVSKAFGEALARHYADRYGIATICLRIGWFLEEPRDEIGLWMWLSPRDGAQVVACAIESNLPFGIFYAISANSRRHWDISDTMEQLGYRPQDDAEPYAERILGKGSAW